MDLVLVLQILYLYFEAYSCISDLILVQILFSNHFLSFFLFQFVISHMAIEVDIHDRFSC